MEGYLGIEPQSDKVFSKIKENELLCEIDKLIPEFILKIENHCKNICEEKELCKGCRLNYMLVDFKKFNDRFI